MTSSDTITQQVAAGQPLSCPVIDLHTHLGQASSEHYHLPYGTPAQVIAEMDRFGVDHALTFPISVSSDAFTTKSRTARPTCGAARPMPFCFFSVANMLLTSVLVVPSISANGLAVCRNAESP